MLTCLLTCLLICLIAYLLTSLLSLIVGYLVTCLLAHLLSCSLAYLLACTCMVTWLITFLLTCFCLLASLLLISSAQTSLVVLGPLLGQLSTILGRWVVAGGMGIKTKLSPSWVKLRLGNQGTLGLERNKKYKLGLSCAKLKLSSSCR